MSSIRNLHRIGRDALGISRACGVGTALSWLGCVARSRRECVSQKNLQPADRLIGDGPFAVRRGRARALLSGEQVFSGLREIWVRDVYLRDDFLRIEPGSQVVDLGANLGNFTNLALAQHHDVRVVAVEPSRKLSESLLRNVRQNGWGDRVRLKRSFIGSMTHVQLRDMQRNPEYSDAPCVSEDDFLAEFALRRIDFLKCDIEGSEFALIEPESRLLCLARQLAIEIHPWGGDVGYFVASLRELGFTIGPATYDAHGGCILLARKT